ncbi:MAG: insulinase family protein [Ignavibacteriales bacterium]|nr:insulinase family protein [Ignavibacteriales bacterium]
MIRYILGIISIIIIGNAAMSDSIFPYKYYKETLPNGLTVIMIPMESPGLVAYYSVVRTGSRDEVEPGKSGFAHFFEHMMFRGTKKYPSDVYDSIVTSIGANSNAYTTDDYTCYHMNFAKDDLEKVIEIESDRFQNLYYEKQAFQTEAGAVYGEYRKNVTQPFALLNEKVQDLAYDVHTYKHTTMGFEADIKAMPEQYEYSLSFFNRFYRPENVVILIAGDIEPKGTMELINKYYSVNIIQYGRKVTYLLQFSKSHRKPKSESEMFRTPVRHYRYSISDTRAMHSIQIITISLRRCCLVILRSVKTVICIKSSSSRNRKCNSFLPARR